MVPAFPGAGEGAGEAGVPVIRILGRKSAAGGNPLNPDAWDPCFWGFLGLYGGFLAEIRPFYPLQNKAKNPLNPPLWERNPINPDLSAR